MLNDIGGCDAEPESWADGWNKAIDTAIKELEDIPAAEIVFFPFLMGMMHFFRKMLTAIKFKHGHKKRRR